MPPSPARRLERTRAVPRHPRRVSGPVRPGRADHAAAAAATVRPRELAHGAVAAPAPLRGRSRTSSFERLRALPDHRVVDRLLRGRACIWLIGLLLGGIVAMQVSLLKLNSGISRAVETTGTLQRQNANMQAEIARLASGERVRAAALQLGMIDPAAGAVRFLRVRPRYDAALAVMRMRAPSAEAKAVMANGGREPALLTPAAAALTTTSGVTSTMTSTTTTTATTTAVPTTTVTTTPDPTTATTTTTPTAPTATTTTTPSAPTATATTATTTAPAVAPATTTTIPAG